MKTAFIIVTIEGLEDMTQQLVDQLKSFKIKNLSIYVINNIRGKQGYAEGANRGIKEALRDKAEFFFIANPDISLSAKWADSLFQVTKHFDVCGYAMNQNNTVYYGGSIDRHLLSGGLNIQKPRTRFSECDFVSGSLLGVSRKVIDSIGFFDESFFMYYEDVDFCRRAKKVGFTIGIDSHVVYDHYESLKSNTTYLDKSYKKFFRQNASWHSWLRLLFFNLKKRPFIFNFLSLNASSLIIKLLNFLLFIFLIKYLTTADYGIYNLVWAHIGLLMPLADFGTTNFGILHLKEQKHITFSDLFTFRLILALIISLTTLIVGYLFRFDLRLLTLVLITLPVIIANAISGSFLIEVSTENKSFIASIVSVTFNIVLIGILIVMLVGHTNLFKLFTLVGAGYMVYSIVNIVLIKKFQHTVLLHIPKKEHLIDIMKKSFIFVLLGFFAGLYFKADVFLLNYFKGTEVVGIYSAGYKFFEALLFIGASYTVSATPIYRKFLHENRQEFLKKTKRDSLILLYGGIVLAILSFFLSPMILPYVLKNDFLLSIRVFQIVIFAFPFMLLSTVFMNTLYLLDKTRWVVGIFMVQIILNVLLNAIFIPKFSFMASSYITVASEIVNAFLVLFLFRKAYANFT